MDYDALVIGAGAGGMESALSLGDMGFKVLLVEKEASIGGKMILLSKVFPTLDCASCICTPRMTATANHPNITTLTYTEVDDISRAADGSFQVSLHKKPTFVDPAKCTGCAQCETVCTVAQPDEFNADLVGRRAAHIAFPQAVPKKAVIDKPGLSPCSFTCPAGVKPHGYVSLVRAGQYAEAFRQHLDDAPLVGCLSRACYAPCEDECSRGQLEGPVSIRGIKRFMVDRYYADHPEPEYGPPERSAAGSRHNQRVAVVGSGPAGLSAAFFLGRAGYAVTVFEAAAEPGGIMRYGIPAYRLSKDILARDIRNITALGVEIVTNTPVSSIQSLHQQGYAALFLATGNTGGRKMAIPGEDHADVHDCMDFLKSCNTGNPPDLKGRTVAVIGGGNVAIDCARSAVRLGAAEVQLVCLESRNEMPAHKWEVQQAEDEGVHVNPSWGTQEIRVADGAVRGLALIRCTAVFDAAGRFNPAFDESVRSSVAASVVIMAIGLVPNTAPFASEITLNRNRTVQVNAETLQTSVPFVFAGGDAATGPSMIVKSIAQGKRAAFYIDRYLQGQPLAEERFDERLPMVDRTAVVEQARVSASLRLPVEPPALSLAARRHTFDEYEQTLSEEQVRFSASRCLDCGGCSECRQCISVCPAQAISFAMRPQHLTVSVGSVVLATGFNVFDARQKPMLGFGRFPNVISGVQMDRILAPTRPYNAVMRPSDGMVPSKIAFVLCAGSRDLQAHNSLCSRVCCMYSLKQAQLLMGALPLADVTIYYIDLRTFGKGFEEFYEQARGMGVSFVKGKVARIEETTSQNLIVQYEDIEGEGGLHQAEHDLVVLAVGALPQGSTVHLFAQGALETDAYSYIKEVDEDLQPGQTSLDGVYVAGAASAIRDIPDTILHAGAAAAQVAGYLKGRESRA